MSADVLTDGEQNDAVEALEVLLGAIVSQLQDSFRHSRAPELTSLSAWNTIQDQACVSAKPLTQMSAAQIAPYANSGRGSESQQAERLKQCASVRDETKALNLADISVGSSNAGDNALEMQAAEASDSQRLIVLSLMVAQNGLAVAATLSPTCQRSATGAFDTESAQEDRQAAPHVVTSDDGSNCARTGDPTLQAWRALSRLPLELALQHEVACARCRRPSASHVSAMLALPLTLPTTEVPFPPGPPNTLRPSQVWSLHRCMSNTARGSRKVVIALQQASDAHFCRCYHGAPIEA